MLRWFPPDTEYDDADGHEPVSAKFAATNPVRGEADDDAEDGEHGDEGGSGQNLKLLHFISGAENA